MTETIFPRFAHSITVRRIYVPRYKREMWRYECRCGKKGKYMPYFDDIERGAKAHMRPYTPKPSTHTKEES